MEAHRPRSAGSHNREVGATGPPPSETNPVLVNGPRRPPAASPRAASCHQRTSLPDRPPERRLGALALTVGLLLVGSLLLAEAKTHHSKRQTALTQEATAAARQQAQPGRDQTNWWNLWWQQYISEAEQPTVRPIVAISYNGQTIKFPQPQDYDQEQQPAGAAANMVLAEDEAERVERAAEKQRPIATASHQNSNWAAVKPTMIQVRQAGQVRANREADELANEAESDTIQVKRPRQQTAPQLETSRGQLVASSPSVSRPPAGADQFGIQMRSSSRANQQQQLQARNQKLRQQQIQQQQMDDLVNSLFAEQQQQQQQHQMSDYETELDNAVVSGTGAGGDADPNSNQTEDDSSSSNMMLPERPRVAKTTTTTTRRPAGRSDDAGATARVAFKTGSTARPAATAASQQPTTSSTTTSTTPVTSRQTSTTVASTTAATTTTTTTAAAATTTTTTTTTRSPDTTTSRLREPLASTSPEQTTTTTSSPEVQTTRSMQNLAGNEAEVSETPITIDGLSEMSTPGPSSTTTAREEPPSRGSSGAEARQTTPSGRVELMNGRPATSGMMLVARPQLFKTTTLPASTSESDTGAPSSTSAATSTTAASPTSPTALDGRSTPTRAPQAQQTPAGATGSVSSFDSSAVSPEPSPTSSTPAAKTTSADRDSTTASVESANATADSSGDSSEESEDDADDSTGAKQDGGLSVNSAGGNSTAEADGADDEGDEEEGETEVESDQGSGASTTVAPKQPAGADVQTSTTSRQPEADISSSAPTTQQPLSTIMDIERLPKLVTSESPQRQTEQTSSVGVSSPSLSVMSDTSGDTTTEEFARVRATSPSPGLSSQATQVDGVSSGLPARGLGASRMLMMTSDSSRGTLESEAGITLPMDPMMKMLMMMMNQQRTTSSLSLSSSPESTPATSSPLTSTSSSAGDLDGTKTTTSRPTAAGVSPTPSTTSAAATRKRLQPPPTTRVPTTSSGTSAGQLMSSSRSPGRVADLERQTADLMSTKAPEESTTTSPISIDDEAGGREPKIELLNMDLVPIQRMMAQTMNEIQQQSGKGTASLQPTSTPASTTVAPTTTTPRVPPMAEVEPGMRLKPLTSPQMQQFSNLGTKQSPRAQQSATSSSSRPPAPSIMAAPNQPNTIYMVMMPPDQAVGNNQTGVNSRRPFAEQAPTTTAQMNTDQQRAKPFTSVQTTMTTPAAPTGSRSTQSLTSSRPFDRLVDGSSTTQVSMTTRKSTSGQQLIQMPGRDAEGPTTSRPRFVSKDQFQQVKQQQQSQKQSAPRTTPSPATTTTTSASTTTTTSGRSRGESSVAATTTGRPSEETTTTQASLSTEAESTTQTGPTSAAPTTTTRPQPTTTTRRREPEESTRQPALEPASTSGRARSEPAAVQKQQLKGKTAAQSKIGGQSSSFIPTKLRTDFNPQRGQTQQEQQNAQQQSNEIAGARAGGPQVKPAESTAASSQRQPTIAGSMQQLANASVPAQSMTAIRQFGGANRMSALKSAPVAFGRPATMMASATGKSAKLANGRQQPEQPTVEFGPAIAVRRPDEPLADGQMPNCTLTGKNFCVITKDYPMNEVRQAVERSFRSVRLMYEELQTVSEHDLQKQPDVSGADNATQLLTSPHGKFACQTKVEMLRPGWARDEISKEWLVVVNTDVFPQRVRTESCAQPLAPCEFVDPFYDSHCQQRYSLHRFIAVDPQQPSRVTTVLMRFKAGCNCFLKRKM